MLKNNFIIHLIANQLAFLDIMLEFVPFDDKAHGEYFRMPAGKILEFMLKVEQLGKHAVQIVEGRLSLGNQNTLFHSYRVVR